MQSKKIFKIIFFNFIYFFTLMGLGIIGLEFYLKIKNPFHLFPPELNKKRF